MKRIILSLTLVLGIISFGFGQQSTKNTADQTLRSSGRVNPSTLGMEFDLPLGNYPGRGFDLPLGLSYSSKVWRFEHEHSVPGSNGYPTGYSWVYGIYSESAAAGWTSSLAQPYIEFTGSTNLFDNEGRPASNGNQAYYIRRITVFLPGGGSHELRAEDEPKPLPATGWEGTFYASDGSGIKYVRNSNPNLGPILCRLYLPDGSYYDFDPQWVPHGWNERAIQKAVRLTDVNGNYAQFNEPESGYPNGSWTDQLGRKFPIMIPLETPKFLTNGTDEELTQEFILPGINPLTPYVVKWKRLGNSFAPRPTPYALHYVGAQDGSHHTPSPYPTPVLFANSSIDVACTSYSSNFLYVRKDNWELDYDDLNVDPTSKFNPMVLTDIKLPNGAKYEFEYNPFGEIEIIRYPAGGHEKFEYDSVASLAGLGTGYQKANRGVTVSRVYESDSDPQPLTSQYFSAVSDNNYRTTVIAPDGTQTDNYMFRGHKPNCDSPIAVFQYGGLMWGYDSVLAGKTYETRVFSSGIPRHIVQRTLTNWETTPTNVVIQDPTNPLSPVVRRNARVSSTQTTTYDGNDGVNAMTSFAYDIENDVGSPLNVKTKNEFNYSGVWDGNSLPAASGTQTPSIEATTPFPTPAGTPARITETKYLTTDTEYSSETVREAYYELNLIKLPTQVLVKDGSGATKAKSKIVYDENYNTPDAPACDLPGWSDPGTSIRGLPTSIINWHDVSDSSAFVATSVAFNFLGSPVRTTDANGNQSEISYTDNFVNSPGGICTFAYPTHTTSAAPGGNGSATGFHTSTTYDYFTGLPVSSTDINGQTTTMDYEDQLRRPTLVTAPNDHQTITEYGQPNSLGQYPSTQRFVKVKSQIDANSWKEGYTRHDGLGRTVRTQSLDGQSGDIFVDTEYDAQGRVKRISNPYCTLPSNPQCSSTLEWTTNTYDPANGRLLKVTSPDGAFVETIYSVATGGTKGTVTTVKDQAGKLRRSVTSALGHLTRIDEPDLSSSTGLLGDISSPYQPTNYTYDVLNNLLTVTQNGSGTQCGTSGGNCSQTRTFTYDALSRLKQAENPESGIIKFTYDSNDNVKTKWDARGVKTIYDYDNLNRLNKRCYKTVGTSALGNTTCASASGETAEPNTPDVSYFYDNIPNAKGKLTKVTSAVSTTEYTSFDILGRMTASKQTTAGGAAGGYTMGYTYNLAGVLIEETFPSGRVVKNVLDNNGDLAIVQSKRNANTGFWRYADSFTYNAAGAVVSMQLGNGRWESTVFNNRLQPTEIKLGTTQGTSNFLKLNYSYGTTNNNGNILSQTITVPELPCPFGVFCEPVAFTAVQTYTYDSLNRVKSAVENTDLQEGTWQQTFDYDRYGNRRFDQSNTTMPLSFANLPVTNPSISPNDNRITSVGWNYDAAGNTLTDAGGQSYVYDGENKQVKASNVSGILGEYYYDGDGRRIKKVAPSDGGTTIFVYDIAGKLVAEYSATVASIENAKVSYLTSDHLGSPRVNTDRDGNVISRHDYHPFGEEIVTNQRAGHTDYMPDSVRKQFTGYERDRETDLDFAQARYFSAGFGRFSSPDNFLNDTSTGDPTSWNLYVYVRNNPLKFTDPTGEKIKIGKIKKDGKEVDALTPEEQKKLLAWLNHVYDCDGCVTIDKTGTIRLDTSNVSQKVKDATKDLTAAIQDEKRTISVYPRNDDSKVPFARALPNTPQLGDVIVVDFKDFDRLSGDSQALSSFTNYAFVHEVLHLYPDPQKDVLSGNDRTGPIENKVNDMRYANGDLLRASYLAEVGADGRSQLWFGTAKMKNGIPDRNQKGKGGIIANEQRRILYWKNQVSDIPAKDW
ncbi:MAG: RHS repeat domain-containing protein [Pyrinomonadaceae bacterium]